MRAAFCKSPTISSTTGFAQASIAVGLAILLAQAYWPAMPIVTALALVALGATLVTIGQFQRAAASRSMIAIHLCVYTSLYFLVIGAVCDEATRASQDGLTLFQVIDLGLSAGVMAFVARLCVASITGGGDAPAR